MRHTASLTIVLCVFWLVNSGHYTPLVLGLGVVSVLFVVAISLGMKLVDAESQPLHVAIKAPRYWLWLMGKLLYSNIDVTWRIWAGRGAISPERFSLKLLPKDDLLRVIVANSITLTPGTVSMNINDDEVDIHALTHDAMKDVEHINQRVAELNR